jgi:dolichyl-phosphate-mannose-protein mannosyltransferase
MTGSVRARRPHSPPPPVYKEHNANQYVDADTKRALASKGYNPSAFNRTSSGKHSSPYPNAGKYYPPGGLSLTSGEIKVLIAVTILACFVRLFRLSKPTSVVFDEVHFGKFAGKYIKTQYFVDVHPPLAKLLITLMGFIFGYDGHFDFKDIGKVYDAGVPYVAMRFLPAILGVFTVPLAYMTLRSLDCRATTALLASFFIMFENGLTTQSRHILLDSPLIFFTSLTTFLWVGFCNEDKHQPFTETWWGYLFLSGLSMGAALSVKWVGLFTVATVGVTVLYQLWLLLGDLRIPPRLFISHFLARALCLILVPLLFYMGMFGIHFAILQVSSPLRIFLRFRHHLALRSTTSLPRSPYPKYTC